MPVPDVNPSAAAARKYRKRLLLSVAAGACWIAAYNLLDHAGVPGWVVFGPMVVIVLCYFAAFFMAASLVWGMGWAVALTAFLVIAHRAVPIVALVPLAFLLWRLTRVVRGAAATSPIPAEGSSDLPSST